MVFGRKLDGTEIEFRERFAAIMRRLRKRKGYSSNELQKLFGFQNPRVDALEKGTGYVVNAKVDRIAKVLDVNPDDLCYACGVVPHHVREKYISKFEDEV